MKKVFCKPATLDAVKEKKKPTSKSKAGAKKRKKAQPLEEVDTSSGLGTLLALEQRIMFDGAVLATGAEVVQDQLTQEQATPDQDLAGVDADAEGETFSNPLTDRIDLSSALSTLSPPSDRREIIFIDTRVEDYQTLLDGIDPNAEAVLLDSTRDGIEQIAEIIGDRSDIDAIHIISYGAQGELQLGTGQLTLETMNGQYTESFAAIGQALTDTADILLYGSNFGEGVSGQEAVTLLAALTGADVAASNDSTGDQSAGGNWQLEVTSGMVEISVIVEETIQDTWASLLEANHLTEEQVAQAEEAYFALPLAFEENLGQTDEQVDFMARGSGYSVFLTEGDAVLSLSNGGEPQVLRLDLIGADPTATVSGSDQLSGTSNYFLGEDSANWQTGVDQYGSILYTDVYEGIDVRYYGTQQRQLEYDFIVAAGADTSQIQFDFQGAYDTFIDANGELVIVLDAEGHAIRFQAPVSYQEGPNGREAVGSRYVVRDDGSIGFELDAYDTSRELVIDPVLSYATYLGGTGNDSAYGIAVDGTGQVYIAGVTGSSDFPATSVVDGSPKSTTDGDAFVIKLSADGSTAIYSTFYGGTGTDTANDIAVDAAGNVYITGATSSSDLAMVGGYDTGLTGAQDIFVAKINPAGNALLYSTYFGGNGGTFDEGFGIAADDSGNAYVVGTTDSTQSGSPADRFPFTAGVVDTTFTGTTEAFVAQFNTTLTGAASLSYATYLGGSGTDFGHDIAIDGSGNAYVVGSSNSNDLSTVGGYDTIANGSHDVFLTVLNSTATAINYSTYLGGTGNDIGYGIALDASNKVYITGDTASTVFPTTAGAYDIFDNPGDDGFVAKFDTSLTGAASLVYSTILGGSGNETLSDIAVTTAGQAVVFGHTFSMDAPTTGDAIDSTLGGTSDAYLAIIDPTGATLDYATYLGGAVNDVGEGVALDSNDSIYVAGYGTGNFDNISSPNTIGSLGSRDAFVAKFGVGPLVVDTTSDTLDGDTSSISALLATKGADGFISLREAITAANNTIGTDTINFDIIGAGPHTINVLDPDGVGPLVGLPSITDAVIIDGYTQSGASANTLLGGSDAVLKIELDGTSAGAGADGLLISATGGGSTIRGLSIQNFDHNGILLQGGSNIIAGNYLGLAADGTTVAGNNKNIAVIGLQGGIRIESASNTIGGLTPADRNVISGNVFTGVALAGAGATGNQVLGNYIGLDAGGTLDRGNTQEGIEIDGADGNTIGGSTVGARNVISGNDSDGMEIDNGDNNIIQGNYIGTDYTGILDRGNTRDGIDLNEDAGNGATGNLIGGTGANEGNLIFGNNMNGVEVRNTPSTGNSILGNQIYGNSLLGIDLGPGNDGVTPNDLPGTWTGTDRDPDSGENNLQNFPVLTTADVDSPTQVTIDGTLDSTGSTTFRIEFYKNTIEDPTNHGEGETYLGFTTVTTDSSGSGTFNVSLAASVTAGEFVTATATKIDDPGQVGIDDALAYGDTSEFALNVTAVAVNDAPIITNGPDTSALTETNAGLTDSGTLTVSDADLTDLVTAAVDTVGVGGTGASSVPAGLTNPTLLSFLTVTPTAILDGTELTDTLTWNFNSGSEAFDFLATGETLILTYTVSATDDDGTPLNDTETVTVTITGTNDAPVITNGPDTSALTETNAGLTDSGTLTVSDADLTDLVTAAVDTVGVGGTGASSVPAGLTNPTLLSFLTVTPTAILDGTELTDTLTWNFNSGSEAFDFLATGETLILTYTVSATDDDGTPLNDTETVTVTITGTNDAPVITNGPDTSALTETNAGLTDSGTLTVSDADLTDLVTAAVDTVGVGGTGASSVPAGLTNPTLLSFLTVTPTAILDGTELTDTLTWNFNSGSEAFDFLATGETLILTYTVSATDDDGTPLNDTETVTVTITGTNDAPVITNGPDTSALTETNAGLTDSGTLTVSDADLTDLVTAAVDTVGVGGTGASSVPAGLTNPTLLSFLTVTPTAILDGTELTDTLTWNFNSGSEAFDFLATGETLILTYTVSATDDDGTPLNDTETVTVTITGTNDAPVITNGPDTSALTETNAGLTDSGTLTVSDADLTDLVTAAVDTVGVGGTGASSVPAGLTNPTLLSFLTVTPTAILDGTELTDTLTWNFNSGSEAFDFLATGETLILTYTVSATDDDGTPLNDTETVTVTITGTNDAPVITNGPDTSALTETNAGLTDSGTLTVSDADLTDLVTAAVDTVGVGGTGASSVPAGLTNPTLLSFLTVTPTAILDGTELTDTLTWNFNSGSEAFDFLATGETLILTYTVSATDDDGTPLNDTETVTVTITGTNDAPVITNGPDTSALTETNAGLTDSGTLTVSDADLTDLVTAAVDTVGVGGTGASSVPAGLTNPTLLSFLTVTPTAILDGTELTDTLTWNFNSGSEAFDFLATGETLILTYTVSATDDDGTPLNDTETVTVTITGTNDAPVITNGPDTSALTETNAGLTDSGTLTVSDADLTDLVTAAVDTVGVGGTGASSVPAGLTNPTLLSFLTVTPTAILDGTELTDTLTWNFNSGSEAFDFLATGETLILTYTVSATDDDGTPLNDTETVTVTITGTNDAPVITNGPDTSALTETNAGLTDSGTLTVSDADLTDLVTAAVDTVGVGGTGASSVPAGLTNPTLLSFLTVTPTAILDGTELTDTLTWNFNSGSEAFDFLATGETLILTYTVSATDDDGTPLNDTETVTVTITGTNDAPVITNGPDTSALTETNAGLTDSGTLTVSDADLTDLVTAAVDTVGVGGTGASSVPAGLTNPTLLSFLTVTPTAILDGTELTDTLTWNFNSGSEAFDFLATGETLILTYTVSATDDDGTPLNDTETVTVTITGTNDAPVITNGPDTSALTETNAGLTDSGTLTVSDADLTDLVTAAVDTVGVGGTGASSVPAGLTNPTLLSFLTVTPTAILDGTELTDTLTWNFNSGSEAFDFLATGETLILTYTVSATDDDGTPLNDTETVTVTITGTNDAPVITNGPDTSALTETNAGLTDSGTLTVSDADLTDLVTAAVDTVGVGGTGASSVPAGLTNPTLLSFLTVTPTAILDGTELTDTLTWNFNSGSEAFDFLATGETLILTYTVSATDDDGTPLNDTETVTVTITGTNDAPVITNGPDTSALTETNAGLTDSGTLTVSDADLTDLVTAAVDTVGVGGTGASSVPAGLTNPTLLSFLTVTPTAILDGTELTDTLTWNFNSGSEAFDFLATGETLILTYTVSATDDDGTPLNDTETVTVTITGTNDAPVITNGPDTSALTETNAGLTDSGTLTVSDADLTDLVTAAVDTVGVGGTGASSVPAGLTNPTLLSFLTVTPTAILDGTELTDTLTWNFNSGSEAFDFLATGETLILTYTVSATDDDGTPLNDTETVTVTITGTNDAPVITNGPDTSALTETNAGLTDSGTLTVSDADLTDLVTAAVDTVGVGGTGASSVPAGLTNPTLLSFLTVTPTAILDGTELTDTLTWNFNSGSEAFDFLATGETLILTYTVSATDDDGTPLNDTETVTVTITGTNDAPVITNGPDTSALTETNAGLTDSGTLTVSDADLTDLVTAAVDTVGVGGTGASSVPAGLTNPTLLSFLTVTPTAILDGTELTDTLTWNFNSGSEAFDFLATGETLILTYTVSATDDDGTPLNDTETVTVTITGTNDAPVITNGPDTSALTETNAGLTDSGTLTVSDADLTDLVTAAVDTVGVGGTGASSVPAGLTNPTLLSFLTVTPTAILDGTELTDTLTWNFNSGSEAFDFLATGETLILTYTVSATDDDGTPLNDTETVTVTITGTNDAPVITNGPDTSALTETNAGLTDSGTLTVSDADLTDLVTAAVDTVGVGGTGASSVPAGLTNPTLLSFLTVTPTAILDGTELTDTLTWNFNSGSEAFDFLATGETLILTYTVSATDDDGTPLNDTETVTVTITGTNDAPVITNGPDTSALTETNAGLTDSGTLTVSDADLTDLVTAAVDTVGVGGTGASSVPAGLTNPTLLSFLTVTPTAILDGTELTDTLTWNFNSGSEAFDFLATGETLILTYTVSATDDDGTPLNDTETVTVTITGTNDAPVITNGPDTSALTETNAGLTDSGTLTVSDADLTDLVTAAVDTVGVGGTGASSVPAGLTNPTLLSFLTVTPTAILDGTELTDTLTWNFNSGSEAFDFLATGETLILTYTVSATDDDGTPLNDTETVTVTITGTNDAPVITNGPDTSALTETNAGLTDSGTLTVSDADLTDLVTAAVDTVGVGGTGASSVPAGLTNPTLLSFLTVTPTAILDGTELTDTLTWNFNSGSEAFDFLATGETLILTYTVSATDDDGTPLNDTETVTVTITGTNDAPVITNGPDTSALTETNAGLTDSGTLTVSDADLTDLVTAAVDTVGVGGTGASSVPAGLTNPTLLSFLTVTPTAILDGTELTDTLTWNFNSGSEAFDFLATGETLILTYTVSATDDDGTPLNDTETVTVTITGTNDAPVITNGPDTSALTETNAGLTDSGTLTVSDADLTDLVTAAVDTVGVGGTGASSVPAGLTNPTLLSFLTVTPTAILDGTELTDTLTWNFNSGSEAFDFLATGETLILTYTVSATDDDGTPLNDTETVTVTITGTNDAPVITNGPDTSALTETNAGLTDSGTLTVSDADLTDLVTAAVDTVGVGGTGASSVPAGLTNPTLLSFLTVTPTAILDGTELTDTLTWNFNSGSEAFDFLATGETLILTYTVSATDDDGTPLNDTETVTVTITGTNDAPVITNGPDTSALTETNAGLTDSGTLTVSDADLTDLVTAAVDTVGVGGTGASSVPAGLTNPTLLSFLTVTPTAILDGTELTDTLTWNFNSGSEAFDFLATGETLILTYTVSATDDDGTPLNDTETVTVTITGTNDAPVITNGPDTSALTETNAGLTDSGTLTVSDADLTDLVTAAVDTVGVGGTGASSVPAGLTNPTLLSFLTVTPTAILDGTELTDTLTWNFNSGSEAFDFLATGETLILTYTVSATDDDGTPLNDTETVTVTITGTNDAPVITNGPDTSALTETNAGLTDSGTLTVSDADLTDLVTAAVDTVGVGGTGASSVPAGLTNPTLLSFLTVTPTAILDGTELTDTLTWNFNSGSEAFDFLATGETLILTYTVSATDDDGTPLNDTETVTVTITGTNDAPVITNGPDTSALTETNAGLTDSGTLTVSDADLTDLVTAAVDTVGVGGTGASSVPAGLTNPTLLSFLTVTPTAILDGTELTDTLTWNFNSGSEAFDFLATGETLILTYTVSATDDDGTPLNDTETVTVTITGTNDAPVITNGPDTSALTETNAGLTDSGTLTVSDADLTDLVTAAVDTVGVGGTGASSVPAGLTNPTLLSFLTVTPTAILDGTELTDTLTWNFNSGSEAFDFLATGETLILTYTVSATDDDGTPLNDTETVTVTITGTNDAPVITNGPDTSALTETNAGLTDSGTLTVSDADLTDLVTAAVDTVGVGGTGASSVPAGLTNPTLLSFLTVTPTAILDGTELTDTLTWNFNSGSEAFDFLATGETLILTYTVSATDDDGTPLNDTETVTVTITGTNDAPVITNGPDTSALTETNAGLTDSGTLTVSDADLTDLVTAAVDTVGVGGTGASSVPAGLTNPTLLSFLTVTPTAILDGTELTDTLTWNFNSGSEAFDFLATGETLILTYTVSATDDDGTPLNDTETVTVTITGTNDAPVITNGPDTSALTETNAGLTDSGTLTVSDADLTDLVTAAVDTVGVGGTGASSVPAGLTNPTLLSFLTVTPTAILDGTELTDTLTWNFNSGSEAFDFLATGETLILTYTVSATDDDGTPLNDTETVTVTITGTNDAPVITNGPDTSALTETNAGLTDSGTLTVSDADLTDLVTAAVDTVGVGGTGASSVPAGLTNPTLLSFLTVTPTAILDGTELTDTLTWNFNSGSEAFDFLATGETLILTYTVSATDDDGTPLNDTETVTVTITGTNDAPVITNGPDTSALTETNAGLTDSGTLTVSDADLTDLVTAAVDTVGVGGTGASSVPAGLTNPTLLSFLTVTPTAILDGTELTDTLTWNFNSGSEAFDFLATGETLILTYTVSATDDDGTPLNDTETVTVTITGTNDAPVITNGPDTSALTETNAGLTDSGTLTVSDADLTDLVTAAVDTVGVGGTGASSVPAGLTNPTLLSFLTVTPTAILDGTELTDTLTWNFNSGSEAFDFLATGETLILTYTVSATDDDGTPLNDTETVTVTITGTNDAPVITNGPDTSALTETNAGLTDSGTLTVSDADLTDLVTAAVDTVGVGGTGASSVPAGLTNPTLLSFLTVTPTAILDGTELTDTLTWNFNSGSEAFDFLATGETLILTYTVSATDDDGTPLNDTETVTVTITGTNDAPVITNGPDTSALTETNAGLTDSGTLTVSDADLTDLVTAAVDTVGVGGTGASSVPAGLTNPTLLSFLTVTPTAILDGTELTDTLTWNFNSGSEAFDFLATGETLILTYTVSATDDDGTPLNDTETVTVTITGTNDAPVITNGPDTSALTETNAGLTDSGTLTVSDADLTDLVTAAVDTVGVGGTGASSVPAGLTNPTLLSFLTVTPTAILDGTELTDTLTWNFNSGSEAFDFLATGETLILTYTVSATDDDGTPLNDTETVTVTITGTNDAPVITNGPDTSALTETNAGLTDSGTLTVSDADLTDLVTAAVDTVGVGGTGASSVPAGLTNPTLLSFLTVTPTAILDGTELTDTLTWNFNSGSEAFDFLATGETLILTYTVSATDDDGTPLNDTETVTVTITGTNDAPVITSDGGLATATVNAAENQAAVTTVTATDVDLTPPGALTYSILGGADQTLFAINSSSGVLTFTSARDFETFTDANLDGVYEVTVQVADGQGGFDTQAISVTVTDVNEGPIITSDGGLATATVNAAENQAAVTTVTAMDVDLPPDTLTYSISGGADQALFSINSSSGVLTFNVAPDYETPADVGGNNVYDVIVQVNDGSGGIDTQAISITVTDLLEGLPPLPPPPPPPPDPTPEPRPNPEPAPDPEPPGPSLNGYGENGGFIGRVPEEDDYLASNREVGDVLDLSPFLRPASWMTTAGQIRAYYGDPLDMTKTELSTEFLQQLNKFSNELGQTMDEQAERRSLFMDMITATGLALTTGLFAWLIRGGALISSLLASLPAWRHFDPVPILGMNKKDKEAWTRRVKEAGELESREHQGIEEILQRNKENPPKAKAQGPTHFS